MAGARNGMTSFVKGRHEAQSSKALQTAQQPLYSPVKSSELAERQRKAEGMKIPLPEERWQTASPSVPELAHSAASSRPVSREEARFQYAKVGSYAIQKICLIFSRDRALLMTLRAISQ